MTARARLRRVFEAAVAACDPAARVAHAVRDPDVQARLDGRRVYAVAVGKAAAAMARGLGPVANGVAITPDAAATSLPDGWRGVASAHPFADARSAVAVDVARELIARAMATDVVVVLISGGASALLEAPRLGLTIEDVVATARAAMAAGLPIAELNAVRGVLSAVKHGRLTAACAAPVLTLAISDVVGDDLAVIGGGPTLHAVAGTARARARDLVAQYRLELPVAVRAALVGAGAAAVAGEDAGHEARAADLARVIAPLSLLSSVAVEAWRAAGVSATRLEAPLIGDAVTNAAALARHEALDRGPIVAWGEPVVVLPREPGDGGRAQQLALALARHLRGTFRHALVVGSDGVDGPPPRGRAAPAGAFVDGGTWDAIAAVGLDPGRALARCDAGTALDAVGALEITGPTGINHADLVLLG